jgi:nitroimidazol reductase NimA-like FMN-containing flavoprotein (pyridoxamine 5'-phosphate oxidase superfamily)
VPTRKRDRGGTDAAAARAILAEGMVAHVGFLRGDWPVVLPFHYGVGDLGDGRGEQIVIHGSTGGRAFLDAARTEAGLPVSVCVSINDALVLGRSSCDIGAHYRGVVVYGHARLVPDDRKSRALDILCDHIIPGRRAEMRPDTAKELAATALLSLPLEHASTKVSNAANGDTPGDGASREIWAGMIPMTTRAGPPVASPETRAPDDLPASVVEFLSRWS